MYHIKTKDSKGKEKLWKIKGDDASIYHASGAEHSVDMLGIQRLILDATRKGKASYQTVFMVPVTDLISCEYKEPRNDSDIEILPRDTEAGADGSTTAAGESVPGV
jgi:hypothetical protein